jgi:hypothetical protein
MLASQYCLLHNLPDIGIRRKSTAIPSIDDAVAEGTESISSPPSPPDKMLQLPNEFDQALSAGAKMLKIPSKAGSRAQERFVRVELSPLRFLWDSKKQVPRTCKY